MKKNLESKHLRSDKGAEGGTSGRGRVSKLEVLANGSLLGVLEGNGGEGLDVQVRALGAELDELSSQCEDGTGLERGVEGSRDGFSAGCDTDKSLMTSLNSNNGGSGGKDIGRVDHGCGTEVGRNTNSLEDTGGLDHGVGAGKGSIEIVVARLNRLGSGSGDSRHQGSDVCSFSHAHSHERLDLSLSEAQGHEVTHGELRETLLVKCRFKMLSSQGTRFVSASS